MAIARRTIGENGGKRSVTSTEVRIACSIPATRSRFPSEAGSMSSYAIGRHTGVPVRYASGVQVPQPFDAKPASSAAMSTTTGSPAVALSVSITSESSPLNPARRSQ